ncbi:MAG: outer membrane protein assembly factor BamA [Acetobacteraceae bacterium]
MKQLRAFFALFVFLALAMPAVAQEPGRAGGRISQVEVRGTQRIDPDTVRSYMLVQVGDAAEQDRIDRSLRALFATGLFRDVTIRTEGARVVVDVVENPLVNRVVFEGNRRISSEILRSVVLTQPRSVFTPAAVQTDRQRILELYARRGRFRATVEPKIVELDQNRVDLVFEIFEGDPALVARVTFVGNNAFSEARLRDVVSTQEQAWFRLLSSSDVYDPERLVFDRELLRRFYLRQGFADVQITGSSGELSPDRSAFFVTFTIEEGQRYRIGRVEVINEIPRINMEGLRREVEIASGDWYDGDAVERGATAIADALQARSEPFIEVQPRVTRNPETATIDIAFIVREGPRAFVERIEISGNTRTEDRVIRREFRLAEGDPMNARQVRRSRDRIRSLGYFSDVQITNQPGSGPERVNLMTSVVERATGEFTLGGGFATDAGLLLDVGIRERNLLGMGLDARAGGVLAQTRSQLDLSVTDPQFLDRNLAAGADAFLINRDLRFVAGYRERRAGFALRTGYEINDRLRQNWSYALIDRDIFDIDDDASTFIKEQAGRTLLSQISTTVTYDMRDSRVEPRSGYVVRVGGDYAGIGGDVNYFRSRADAQYYIPFERWLNDPDFVLVLSAGGGILSPIGDEDDRIVDRFFLGGENLRGFRLGGAGPRDLGSPNEDSLGGRVLWTSSAEMRFPLPLPNELGLLGRTFVDVGSLSGIPDSYFNRSDARPVDDGDPRVSVGVGFSWRSPIGLINLDFGRAVVKKDYDKTQIFRLGFGTRF